MKYLYFEDVSYLDSEIGSKTTLVAMYISERRVNQAPIKKG